MLLLLLLHLLLVLLGLFSSGDERSGDNNAVLDFLPKHHALKVSVKMLGYTTVNFVELTCGQ